MKSSHVAFLCMVFVFAFIGCNQKNEPMTIEGQVTDAMSGLPVVGCVVRVHPGDTLFTVTNEEGRYDIKSHSGYKLVFTGKGYEEKVLFVTAKTMNVQLHAENFLFFEEHLFP
ncbi:carboxypeptidase-like regulatory domain-containing protein [Parabacteroides sp. OttesenSCG-928-O15]|nr:carboxypeptidase-like regulatory domain-containing protein [Parabacteroides sp. OttesenSCG-928-O15]